MKLFKEVFVVSSLFLAIFFFFTYLGIALYIGNQTENDTKKKSDVIIVLGSRSYINQKYNPCLVSRMEHAVELYRANYASKILVWGGYDKEDHVSEAETMKKIALEKNVPAADIILEKNSTSTYENFVLSKPLLEENNLHSAIIVTEPFHMARASLIAKKLGIPTTASPATDSTCWQPWKYASKYFLKEPFAIALYKLQNKL